MAGQQTDFPGGRSLVGTALVGLGMFILYGNLASEFAHMTHALGANGSAAFGVLPAVMLWVSHLLRAYGAGHQRFAYDLLQHFLMSAWPLLLVMTGTALSRDAFTSQHEPRC